MVTPLPMQTKGGIATTHFVITNGLSITEVPKIGNLIEKGVHVMIRIQACMGSGY